jgi:hypothetical protein
MSALKDTATLIKHLVSGLVGVYVTVPNALNMLDWALPRTEGKTVLQKPRSATGFKAPPAAASALSTPPI